MLLHLTLGVLPRDPAALVAPSAKRPATAARAAATELAAVASPSPPPAPNEPPNVTAASATVANATAPVVLTNAAQGEQAEAMSGPTVRFYLYEPQSLSSFAACERDPGMRPGEVNLSLIHI